MEKNKNKYYVDIEFGSDTRRLHLLVKKKIIFGLSLRVKDFGWIYFDKEHPNLENAYRMSYLLNLRNK